MRTCYRILLWLHPPAFRREFGGEMLWIFDQAAGSGAWALFRDGVASLGRQWLLRSGLWKIALALALALLEISTLLQFGRHTFVLPALDPVSAGATDFAHQKLTVGLVMCLAVLVIGGLAGMVIGLTLWLKFFNARRSIAGQRGR